MIQITRLGVRFSGSSEDLAQLRDEFQRRHCFRLPSILEPRLLEEIHELILRAPWYERTHGEHGEIGSESSVGDEGLVASLNFLMHDAKLFRILEEATGCPAIGSFDGRVYRLVPNSSHHDSWHGDVGDHRVLALSLNLTKEPYSGGVLQIRHQDSDEILAEVVNSGFGDAIVFRLGGYLLHRVTGVTGSVSKTAFAGWFKSQPVFWSSVKARIDS